MLSPFQPFQPFRSLVPPFLLRGIVAWTPAQLSFASGLWIEPLPLSKSYQDEAGATPVTAVEQSVGKSLDRSGLDNHMAPPTPSARPLVKSDSDIFNFKFDGIDDALSTGPVALGADMDFFMALRKDSAERFLIGYAAAGNPANYFGEASPEASWACYVGSGTAATVFVDGVQLEGGTSVAGSTLYAATLSGWHILEFRNLDLSGWTGFGIAGYPTYCINGAIAGVILCPAQTPENRAKIRSYLGAKAGIAPDQAMLNMYAYSGGQNGAYLDLTDMGAIRQDITKESAAVTASGQPAGRLIDKSANDNDVWAPNGGGERGTFNITGASRDVIFNTALKSNTGGGSGENPESGFFFVGLVEPQGYYHVLWSDKVGHTGREIRYDPDTNSFVFAMGTGTETFYALVGDIATLYSPPPAGVKWLVQARHEGTNFFLKIDDRPEAVTACPVFAAGDTNFSIGGYHSAPGDSTGRIAFAAHVFNPLTPALRAAAVAYVASKKA
jgi:hypothetical protein